MTKNDLRILFKRETGKDPQYYVVDEKDIRKIEVYVEWLEDKICTPTDTVLIMQNGKINSSSPKIGG